MISNSKRKSYIEQVYQVYHAHDQSQSDRLQRLRSIEPVSAELLSFIVLSKQAKHILEIGTSGGYSTLWLADAALRTQGHITSLDIDDTRQQIAKKHLEHIKLDNCVTLICQDALAFLQDNHQCYDVVLLDAERQFYCDYWCHLKKCLSQAGGVLIVDNVISHAEQVQDFIKLVASDDQFSHSIVPVGAGLLLAVRQNDITKDAYDKLL